MYKNKKVFAIIDAAEEINLRSTDKKKLKKENKKIEEIIKIINQINYEDDYFKKPILANTLEVFEKSDIIDEIYLIIDEKDEDKVKEIVGKYNINKITEYIYSDNLRQYSIENALDQLVASKKQPQFIITHDARVPFISEKTIKELSDGMQKNMACVFAYSLGDSVKKVNKENMKIEEKIGVHELWQTQFPKMFLSGILISAYDYAEEFNLYSEDDSTLIEYMRFPIKVLEGNRNSLKLNLSIFDTLDRVFKDNINIKYNG